MTFNIELDFFEIYPQYKLRFKDLIKDQENESNIMWAVAYDLHPDSPYRSLDEEFRRQTIEQDLGEIPWKELEEVLTLFKNIHLSKKEKYLIEWETKLDERQNFIASLPYDQNNYDVLDKMMSSTEKMWKQYLTCLKDVIDEKNKVAATIGNAVESASDQGLI